MPPTFAELCDTFLAACDRGDKRTAKRLYQDMPLDIIGQGIDRAVKGMHLTLVMYFDKSRRHNDDSPVWRLMQEACQRRNYAVLRHACGSSCTHYMPYMLLQYRIWPVFWCHYHKYKYDPHALAGAACEYGTIELVQRLVDEPGLVWEGPIFASVELMHFLWDRIDQQYLLTHIYTILAQQAPEVTFHMLQRVSDPGWARYQLIGLGICPPGPWSIAELELAVHLSEATVALTMYSDDLANALGFDSLYLHSLPRLANACDDAQLRDLLSRLPANQHYKIVGMLPVGRQQRLALVYEVPVLYEPPLRFERGSDLGALYEQSKTEVLRSDPYCDPGPRIYRALRYFNAINRSDGLRAFSYMASVLIADDYLHIVPGPDPCTRFFRITTQLPLELQAYVCGHCRGRDPGPRPTPPPQTTMLARDFDYGYELFELGSRVW